MIAEEVAEAKGCCEQLIRAVCRSRRGADGARIQQDFLAGLNVDARLQLKFDPNSE